MKKLWIVLALLLVLCCVLAACKEGAVGESAYEIAVRNGFVGSEAEWLASLKGEMGATGATGAQGEKGEKGETGAQGEKGDGAVNENPQCLDFYPLPDGTYGVKAGKSLYLEKITVPATYQGKAVTQILPYAFYDYTKNTTLKEIEIPTSVTSIGSSAFSNCTSLTSVTFAEGSALTSIGSSAFEGCRSLTSITIPASVTSIDEDAFYGCTNLIQEENGVHYVDKWVIDCDTSVTNVTLRADTIGIGYAAFYNCSSLTSVTIPASVTSIGTSAFRDCTSLASVHITDIAAWCNIGFSNSYANPLYYAKNLYLNGTLVTDLVIPASVTSIGSSAFWGCSSLTSIHIPASVTSIGYYAFRYCDSLTSVTFAEGSKLTSIGVYAFEGCRSLTSITIPASVTSIDPCAFSGCTSLTSVTFANPDGWWVSASPNATSGKSVNVSDAATAATLLKSTYLGYCWKRS